MSIVNTKLTKNNAHFASSKLKSVIFCFKRRKYAR